MKRISGNFKNINNWLVGKFSWTNNIWKRKRIVYCKKKPFFTLGIIGYIVPQGFMFQTNKPIIETSGDIPFEEGDIISISTEGIVSVVWEINSPHNALYVTDLCNSKCIMCPQIERAKARYDECLKIIELINFKIINSIGITGGEPTLNINKLIEILEKIAQKSPNQNVHILTNGRLFSNIDIVNKLVNVKNLNISVGIPLYSDIAEEHDCIVGVNGAFQETIKGLYNLALKGISVEIRTVILRQNYKRLKELAQYIFRNLTFVSHIALMSMEYHGNAELNYDLVNIDPVEYQQELYEAVREFVRYNMVVDVYNTPLCLVDKRINEFCRDSISTWKKTYLPQCNECVYKDECSGVFETSFIQSKNIKPFK